MTREAGHSMLCCDQGSYFQYCIVIAGHDSTLNDMVKVPRWTVTTSQDTTLNCDPGQEFTRVLIQRWMWILVKFQQNFWPIYTSSTRLIVTHDDVNIQRRAQKLIANEGHNSTKTPLNIDPGSVFNGEMQIWSHTGTVESRIIHTLLRKKICLTVIDVRDIFNKKWTETASMTCIHV